MQDLREVQRTMQRIDYAFMLRVNHETALNFLKRDIALL